jgi:uncharacterized membrane protein (UPF0127 family)
VLPLMLLGSLFDACGHAHPPAQRPEPQVVLRAPSGSELRVRVELARSEPERQRGLMYRDALDSGRGMLFLFDRPDRLKFWMKNTRIPLDMIFIDEHRRIVYVEENAEPLTLRPRGPDVDTLYVLEVPGGWTRANGVGPGFEVRFENVD